MTAKDALKSGIAAADMILGKYVADLSDADLFVRPVPGVNHLAWQLGHLIVGEQHFIEIVSPGTSPKLPEGFAAAHSKETIGVDDPSKFYTVAQYKELWEAQRKATLAALEAFPDEELDKADPKYPPFAPTAGAIFGLCSWHPLMHTGQFVPVRRILNKPVVI